jgi:hypothetical protein
LRDEVAGHWMHSHVAEGGLSLAKLRDAMAILA